MTLEILPIGAPVQFGPHEGHILRIQLAPPIETPNILYEIGYWSGDGGKHWHETWVNSFMVTSVATKDHIGFSRS